MYEESEPRVPESSPRGLKEKVLYTVHLREINSASSSDEEFKVTERKPFSALLKDLDN